MDDSQHVELRRRRVRKRKSKPEGEKIVRDDGSVVIRRRSQKRRSRQPHKESKLKRRKRSLILIIIAFLLCFLLVLGGAFTIAFHNSNTFKEQLTNDIAARSGAEVQLNGFKADYAQAGARSLKLEWQDGDSWLKTLELYDLKTQYVVGGLINSNWHVDRVGSSRGLLQLSPTVIQNLGSGAKGDDRFSFESIQCSSLDVTLEGDEGKWAEGINLIMRKRAKSLDLLIEDGTLNLPALDGFRINQGLVRVLSDKLECVLRLENVNGRGAVSLKGDVGYEPLELYEFAVDLEAIDTSMILGDSLSEVFTGEADAKDASLTYNTHRDVVNDLEANLQFDELQIYGFPFLAELSKILRKQWYRRPSFTDGASMSVRRDSKTLELVDINLMMRDRMVLLGDVTLSDGKNISGKLLVGLPVEHKLMIEKSVRSGVFATVKDGYLWQEIEVSGVSGKLSDNFPSMVLSRSELLDIRKAPNNDSVEPSADVQPTDEAFNELLDL